MEIKRAISMDFKYQPMKPPKMKTEIKRKTLKSRSSPKVWMEKANIKIKIIITEIPA
jgi:hypothetical protein